MLDLHGIKHKDVEKVFDKYIFDNYLKSEIKVITGNSVEMKKIIKDISKKYNYNRISEFSGYLILK